MSFFDKIEDVMIVDMFKDTDTSNKSIHCLDSCLPDENLGPFAASIASRWSGHCSAAPPPKNTIHVMFCGGRKATSSARFRVHYVVICLHSPRRLPSILHLYRSHTVCQPNESTTLIHFVQTRYDYYTSQ